MEFNHISVLLKESIENLNINPHGIYMDLTLGKGGHSKEILKKLDKDGLLIAVDQDQEAIDAAKINLSEFSNVLYIKNNFENIDEILKLAGVKKINGALMDIGVSSYQIDNKDRGFSYMKDGPLDMRMDVKNELTAKKIVNEYSLEKLQNIFSKYGEERFSRTIARKIIEYRKIEQILTTFQLRNIVINAIKTSEAHPEKRVFQALRIEVNRELEVLENTLEKVVERLGKGGRLCVISFHSLEDRIVKNKFKEMSTACLCPPSLPVCVCNHKKTIKIITKKPIEASEEEIMENKRSHSAKLRVCERI